MLVDAYWELWRVLNAGTAKTPSTTYNTTPSWLGDLTATSRFEGTSITPAIYKDAWNDFYSAFSTLSTAITGQTRTLVASKISYYASYNIPTPPYTAGAMWFKLASQNPGETNGVLYQCINSRPSGTGQMSDWKKVSNFGVSIGSMLATLYSHWEEKIKILYTGKNTGTYDCVPVYIQNAQPTITYPIVWFNPSNGVVFAGYNTWKYENIAATGNNADPTLITLFTEIYNTLGEFSFNFRSLLYDGATLYDICGKRSSFTDSFTKQTIEGQLSVWMKGENAWTQVLDNTEGILQNYGDHIVAAIYGVNASSAQTMSSDLTLAKNFAQLMLHASSANDDNLEDLAGIKVVADIRDSNGYVTKGHVEVIGDFISQDGEVVIEQFNNPNYITGDNIKETATLLKFSPDGQYGVNPVDDAALVIGNFETIANRDSEPTVVLRNPFIQLNAGNNSYRVRIDSSSIKVWRASDGMESHMQPEGFYTEGAYHIINPSSPQPIIMGVGTASSPVTFTTADGKTVTVIGGIITSVS